jgi:2-keto-4-pentenoate hydratase/2-oxohepta-3-ene-1,7-dioic acid hydratase in catechol pathway
MYADHRVRLVTYRLAPDTDWRSGALLDDQVIDGEALGWPRDMRDLLARIDTLGDLREAARSRVACGDALPLATVRLGPPVPDPGKILCVGLNYAAHAAESNMARPDAPEVFAKFANAVLAPDHDVVVPPRAQSAVDYEGELAVVIGRRASRLTAENALDHVAGYTVLDDVSARDLQLRGAQWTMGKAIDGFAPMGPALTLRDDIADVQNLELTTRVNGEVLQQASTASMLFTVVDLLVEITSVITLEPGDIIATGTPEGVGMARTPQRYLVDGDVVEVTIDGLGTLRNTIRMEGAA